MVRPVKWRYAHPFRVTPPFGGVGHWEGSGYHWEQSGSGYGKVTGDEWYQLVATIDEGYDEDNSYYDPDVTVEDGGHLVDQGDWDNTEIGDLAYFGGFEWTVIDKYDEYEIRFFLSYSRVAQGAYHHIVNHVTVLIDYWNAWIYERLQWIKVGSGIRRSHV